MSTSIWPDDVVYEPVIPSPRTSYERRINEFGQQRETLLRRLPSIGPADVDVLLQEARELRELLDQLDSETENDAERDLHAGCSVPMLNLTVSVGHRIAEWFDPIPGPIIDSADPELSKKLQQLRRTQDTERAQKAIAKHIEDWLASKHDEHVLACYDQVERYYESYDDPKVEARARECLHAAKLGDAAKTTWIRLAISRIDSHVLAIGADLLSSLSVRSLPEVEQGLRHTNAVVRQATIKTFGRDINILAQMMNDDDSSVRTQIVEVFLEILNLSPKFLVPALDDREVKIRKQILQLFEGLYPRNEADTTQWTQISQQLCTLAEEGEDLEIREKAIECLAWVGGPDTDQCLHRLGRWLSREPAVIRRAAKRSRKILRLMVNK